MKLYRKIILAVFTFVLIVLPATAMLLLQLPFVQTKVSHKVLETISENFNGTISFSNIYYELLNRIVVKDILLTDTHQDTVIYCKKLLLNASIPDLLQKKLTVNKLLLADGVVNLVHTSETELNITEIFPAVEKEPQPFPFSDINIDRLQLKDFKLNRINEFGIEPIMPIEGFTVDWRDLKIFDMNVDIRNIKVNDFKGSLEIAGISMKEKRGFEVNDVSLNVDVSDLGLMVENLHYNDKFTDLSLNHAYILTVNPEEDFADFLNNVTLDVRLDKDCFFDFKSLQGYLPGLQDLNLQLFVEGDVFGTVNDLNVDNFKVYSGTRKTFVGMNARLSGLPLADETMVSLEISDCYTDTKDLDWIITHVSPIPSESLQNLAPGYKFKFHGSLNGFFEDFVAYGELESNGIGKATVDIICRNDRISGYEVIGMMNTEAFHLGNFVNVKDMGEVACNATVSLFAARDKVSSQISLEELNIDKFEFNDYTYSGISAHGTLTPTDFIGKITSEDPNLKLGFEGVFSFPNQGEEGETRTYDFSFKVDNVDLVALNFDEKRESHLEMDSYARFQYIPESELSGYLVIDSLKYDVDSVQYNLGRLRITSEESMIRNESKLGLKSSFLEGEISTNAPFFTDIIGDVKRQTLQQHIFNLTKEEYDRSYSMGNWYNVHLKTLDMRPICAFFIPDLHVEPGTDINVSIDRNGLMNGIIKSDLLALNNTYIEGLNIDLSNDEEAFQTKVSTNLFQHGDMKVLSDTLSIKAVNNTVDLSLSYNNRDGQVYKGHLNSMVEFPDTTMSPYSIIATIYDSSIDLYNNHWEMDESAVFYSDKNIVIDNFGLRNGGQSLVINGTLSENREDTCKVILNNFDARLLNPFVGSDFNFEGDIIGQVDVVAPFSDFDLNASIDIESLSLVSNDMGDLSIECNWMEDDKLFNFNIVNIFEKRNPLKLDGTFTPMNNRLAAKASLDKLNIAFVEPILSGIMERISGSLSGDINIAGPLDSLDIISDECLINNMNATVSFTQVPYIIDGSVTMDEQGILARNLTVTDRYGSTGKVSGGLFHNHMNDLNLDLDINFNNIHGIETTVLDNPVFYGEAFATGSFHIGGPFNALQIGIKAKTEQNTNIHIPLGNAVKEQASILSFISDVKPVISSYDSLINLNTIKADKMVNQGLKVNAQIEATPDADIQLEINRTTGDILKGKGVGYVDINIADDIFDIRGDYSLNEGSYRFGMLNIITKDFTITPGSKINFVGDVLDSEFDIQAIYKTKASIAALVSDSTSTTNRRNVNCGLNITGKLSDLDLDFDIEIPDLDPATQGIVETAFNSEEKQIKQFLTLLVSGSFLPDEQSGITNNSTISYLNATEILSNQLNTILNQLNIPVDFGFNYQLGQSGKSIFDVAISTQLFNNRVSINGNIGNREYLSSAQSDIVGDIDVEIKLNKNGNVRLNLFSHSADKFSSYLDQTQRNGAGIVVQQDFNSFKELFRNIFWSKKRKAEYKEKLGNNEIEDEDDVSSSPIILKSKKR